jgi:hypothetical protein
MTHTPTARRLGKVVAALALAGTAIGLTGAAAGAASGATTDVPASGLAVQCVVNQQPVTYTATGGTMHIVNRSHVDSTGVEHFTGTISLQGVTATDGTTNVAYQIVGASWFGGKGTSPAAATVRSTDEFNIIGPGGKVASVHAHVTFNPDGSITGASVGDCQPGA